MIDSKQQQGGEKRSKWQAVNWTGIVLNVAKQAQREVAIPDSVFIRIPIPIKPSTRSLDRASSTMIFLVDVDANYR